MWPLTESWNAYETMLYNAWLSVDVARTPFLEPGLLEELGIYDQVIQLWVSMGMGTLGIQTHALYPDLVRQFMATLRIRYRDDHLLSATAGELHFKLHGRKYVISMTEFAGLYGLDTSSDLCNYSDTFTDAASFFQLIGDEPYDSSTNRLIHVRHPVLRYVLKLLGSTFFCKREINRVRTHELLFLYFGVSEEAFPGTARHEEVRPHLGAVFALYLLTLQGRPFDNVEPVEKIGSLLTPLFERCGEVGSATDGILTPVYLGQ